MKTWFSNPKGRLKSKIPPCTLLPPLRPKRGGGSGWGWQFAELHFPPQPLPKNFRSGAHLTLALTRLCSEGVLAGEGTPLSDRFQKRHSREGGNGLKSA